MRASLLLLAVGVSAAAPTQKPAPDLSGALAGQWTGVLEYRDYSEPAGSTKRVQLPTWLTVEPTAAGLRFHYVYDDGPNKVVEGRELVVLDLAAASWSVTETEHPQRFAVAGLDRLRDGRGELTLTGPATENHQPVDERETVTVRRNLLVIEEETRPAGSSEPFAFRHRYVLTRAAAPGSPASR